MKKSLFILLIWFSYTVVNAQETGCDDIRYIEDIFTEIKVTPDLKFGEGSTISGNFQDLFLDVYEPVGDALDMRPVIILAFGGSFIGGQKEDVDYLCEAYARKGFVAVAIDYRLYDGPFFPLPNADQMKEVVIKTVSDMRAAIRYMREDAATDNNFRVNPEFIFIGGVSAGSITALHTAVIDEGDDLPEDIVSLIEENGGFEGNTSTNYEYSSSVQGLVNFSGGLNQASWIDENDPPFISVHDDMDPVVPYGSGFATIFGIPIIAMEGSGVCHAIADDLGIMNELKTIENSSGHVSFLFTNADIVENINFTSAFLAQIVCEDISTSTVDQEANRLARVEISPNPTSGWVQIGGIDVANYNIEVINNLGMSVASYSNTSQLDLQFLQSGMYYIRIWSSELDYSVTQRIVLSN